MCLQTVIKLPALSVSVVFLGKTLNLPCLLMVVVKRVYGSLASVQPPQGSCGYNPVAYHHQSANVCVSE